MSKKRSTEEQDASPRSETQQAQRTATLERFLRDKPWTLPLSERHRELLALKDLDHLPEDLVEYAVSLVTGLALIGRQGYDWPDKPPFDVATPEVEDDLLVDAKAFDTGVSKAQHTLKVKRERPRKQFRRWTDGGEKAIPCQFARGRDGWYLIPGIPTKDVRLNKATAALTNDPMKPLLLLDKADISEWNDFENLHKAWEAALAHLRLHKGEIMSKVKEEREKFTAKEALEITQHEWEDKIWIDVHLTNATPRLRVAERIADDSEATRVVAEQAFLRKEATTEIVQEAFQHREATQQIVQGVFDHQAVKQQVVAQAFQDEEAKKQIVTQVSQDKEARRQVVAEAFQNEEEKKEISTRVFQDENLMRERLGEDLFQLWKTRQQPTTPPAAAPQRPGAPQPPG